MQNEGTPKPEPQSARPLDNTDRLARVFPADLYTPKQLVGQLLPLSRELSNWTRYKKADLSAIKDRVELEKAKYYGWNPEIKKYNGRWLIKVSGSANLRFGIDALRLGLSNTVDFDDLTLLPYIHFKEPKPSDIEPTGLEKHGVASADLILLNRWQIDDLRAIVDSIDQPIG